MTIDELEKLLRKENVFGEFGINRLGIFGSFARGENYNDIDILLEQNMDYKKREQLKSKLQTLLKTKVDLVPEKFVDAIILYRARKVVKYIPK